MVNVKKELSEWLGNVRGDVLAGLVSSFAVIPEVVGFCIVAGISPMMGLYASFWLTVLMAFIGGRPRMISAAAGSMALVIVIIYLFPRVTKTVPSTLVSVIVVTAIAIIFKAPVRTIGDMGDITAALPLFRLPAVPLNNDSTTPSHVVLFFL